MFSDVWQAVLGLTKGSRPGEIRVRWRDENGKEVIQEGLKKAWEFAGATIAAQEPEKADDW